MSEQPPRVLFSFPTRLGTSGIGTTAWHQVTELARLGVDVSVVAGSVERPLPHVRVLAETMRMRTIRLPYRAIGFERALASHDHRAARIVAELSDKIDVLHAWPAGAERTLLAARRHGIPALLERPNAHTAFAFSAVAEECARLGIAVDPRSPHAFDASRLAHEEREYAAADGLLCPSEFVASTFRERGFAGDRLLRHQYGFDPARFSAPLRRDGTHPFSVAFVGRGEPRKGLHTALTAWTSSPCADAGRFVIAGSIEAAYRSRLEPLLAHPSVHELGHVDDPAAVMRESDALVLPSVEEGSALVTYEARAAAASCWSPTAAGRRAATITMRSSTRRATSTHSGATSPGSRPRPTRSSGFARPASRTCRASPGRARRRRSSAPTGSPRRARSRRGTRAEPAYSTVTVLARLRGWSTLRPRRRAIR